MGLVFHRCFTGAIWSDLGFGNLARESNLKCKPAIFRPYEKVSELLRTYPSRGDQVRILWNLLVIADQEGRNYHVSSEALTAHFNHVKTRPDGRVFSLQKEQNRVK